MSSIWLCAQRFLITTHSNHCHVGTSTVLHVRRPWDLVNRITGTRPFGIFNEVAMSGNISEVRKSC